MFRLILSLLFLAGTTGCSSNSTPADTFQTGAERLVEQDLEPLAGQRVGIIANHTARVDTAHLVDVVDRANNVELTAIFGPEHGLRGEAAAGEEIADGVDEATGVPVYSLYGENRSPTPDMLKNVDVLVFDIQDIGARFYTYISTMGLSMQAAAEQDIPFVVLDRPNPLGGNYVSGFIRDPSYRSFVGLYPIPIAHGMTVGELAQMIKGEGWLEDVGDLELEVISMLGWQRSDTWPQPAEDWVAPSPNIPDLETARIYPGAAFFEGTTISEGRGTHHPFRYIGAPWGNGDSLAQTLEDHELPGVSFKPVTFTPESIPGMDPSPKLEGQQLAGIQQSVTDAEAFRPVETGVYVLHAFYEQAPRSGEEPFFRSDWLANLAGTDRMERMLRDQQSPAEIIESWKKEVQTFKKDRRPYLLY